MIIYLQTISFETLGFMSNHCLREKKGNPNESDATCPSQQTAWGGSRLLREIWLLCSFHQADLLRHHVNPPFCFGTSKEKMPPNIFTFLSISFPGPSIWVDKNCLGFFDAGILIRIAFGLRIFKDRADRAHLMGTEHFFRGGFSESFGKKKQHEHLE